ncbi:MAG: coenzyme F430 synthase [Methanomicrobiales archaeon]|nr:coenzyme F430 synthase [Methanomicrobiales archaeon]
MQILVLDTIHGGKEIALAFADAGHTVDAVDVYHGTTPDLFAAAKTRPYNLIVAPVHLDPDHPLLKRRNVPVITHHEAVRQLLENNLPHPMVEITGTRGKTTTAHALAHVFLGKGVLHTSTGTYTYPTKSLLWKRSITPASILSAVKYANQMPGWLIAEESLGVTGAADLAIITSSEDYKFANGRKCAIKAKIASAAHAKRILVADNVLCDYDNVVRVGDVARCDGMECTVAFEGMKFIIKNPLFLLPPYRASLMLAAAAAMILHINPVPLNHFAALPGRMSVSNAGDLIVIDNSNSGTNVTTTLCAARYARHCAGSTDLTLVIGQAESDGAVCEGFAVDQIIYAIEKIEPRHVVWVGKFPEPGSREHREITPRIDVICPTLDEGRQEALRITRSGSIVLAVKTWR